MNLIDTTYFINDIWLPVDEIGNELTASITKYQKEILIKCLGFDLYAQFMAEIEGDYSVGSEWDYLYNGTTWTDSSGYLKEWVGFKNAEKESLIAYWVYYKYLFNSSVYAGSSGGKISNSENASNVDSREKQMYAYNKCIELMNSMDDYINHVNSVTPATYDNYEFTSLGYVNTWNI